ncbi:MAG: transporter substrate-binding domain-containing protein [Oceanospirillaceae bacterium]
MTKQKHPLLFVILIGLTISHSISQKANADKLNNIKVCWESELKPPYLMQDNQGVLKGIAVDLVQKMMLLQDISFQNIVMPWKRCLRSLQRGSVDLVPNASFKHNRTEFALYSREIYRTHLDFFYIKDKIPNAATLNTIQHFTPYKVGGVRGFNYAFFEEFIAIESGASNRRALLLKLKKGRVDFAILQREVVTSSYQDDPEFLTQFASIPAPNNSFNAFYVLAGRKHKNATQLVSAIDTGLAQLRESGAYQRILDQYLK